MNLWNCCGVKANWNGAGTAAHFRDSEPPQQPGCPKVSFESISCPGWCPGCAWGSLRRVIPGQDQNFVRDRLQIALTPEIPVAEKVPWHFFNCLYNSINLCQQLYSKPWREQRRYILYYHVWINCLIKLLFNFSFIKYVSYILWFFHFKIHFPLL